MDDARELLASAATSDMQRTSATAPRGLGWGAGQTTMALFGSGILGQTATKSCFEAAINLS